MKYQIFIQKSQWHTVFRCIVSRWSTKKKRIKSINQNNSLQRARSAWNPNITSKGNSSCSQKTYLQSFRQEETLLDIVLLRIFRVDVLNSRVAARDSAMFLQRLNSLPSPISVLFIFGQPVQVEVRLYRFRPQNVVLFWALERSGLGALWEPAKTP